MRFIFLGIAGSLPTQHCATTGVYLPDHGILLDGGTGVFALRDLHQGPELTVLMSHYHLDHSAGLFFLASGLFDGRDRPQLRAFGPEGHEKLLSVTGDQEPLFPISLPFPLETAPRSFKIGDVQVETRPVKHSAPCNAYRLTFPDGQSLAYVTDTTAPGDYVDFIRGADVLIHECQFPASQAESAREMGHSTADSVGRLAREAGVGTLYMQHLCPLSDWEKLAAEARAEFPNTILPLTGVAYPCENPVDPRIGVFPGSFDPPTVGHLDIINSCAAMFSRFSVVVARNPAKDQRALFTPDERAELLRDCVPLGVKVEVWDGLTVHHARAVGAGRLVRGLGRAEDYHSEVRMWKTNALLASEIQTVWVPPRAEHLDVSSSMIKEAAMFGGWQEVKSLVPEAIRERVGLRVRERLRSVS